MDPTAENSPDETPQHQPYVRKPEDTLKHLWVAFAITLGLTMLINKCVNFQHLSLILTLYCLAICIAWIPLEFVLLYRWWGCIQDGNPRTTPDKAVWFCFIPIYNLYWWSVAIVGLSKDINAYCREREIDTSVNEKLAVLTIVLLYGNFVLNFTDKWLDERVSMLAGAGLFVAGLCMSWQFTSTAIAILKAKQKQ